MKKAVFIDRDGTLIKEVNYLADLNQVDIYQDVPDALKRLQQEGYLLIIITNQSGVARGYFDEEFVQQAYERINKNLASSGVKLDAVYYCPHHLDGKAPYNISCNCRKPAPGMILDAVSDLQIDLNRSYVIGDKLCDIELAINAHVAGILVETGYGAELAKTIKQKYPNTPICPSFSTAVDIILSSK